MRSLEYRSPRLMRDFCVDFVAGTALFRGTCVDLNGQGVRASFEQPVPKSLVGSLIMYHPLCRASIPARVVYLLKDQVGFVFFDHTRHDQEVLSHFMGIVGI
jgi:hypothetical protein